MKLTNDAHLWARKWSTWLALFAACAGSALAAYAALPPQAQATVPTWALAVLSAVAIFCALLIPLATSLSQSAIAAARLGAEPAAVDERAPVVTEEMVSRFLGWRLPDDFYPDNGISFVAPAHPSWWPSGTNLLHAGQARRMLEHVLGGG